MLGLDLDQKAKIFGLVLEVHGLELETEVLLSDM